MTFSPFVLRSHDELLREFVICTFSRSFEFEVYSGLAGNAHYIVM